MQHVLGNTKCVRKSFSEILSGRDNLGELSVDGRKITEMDLREIRCEVMNLPIQ